MKTMKHTRNQQQVVDNTIAAAFDEEAQGGGIVDGKVAHSMPPAGADGKESASNVKQPASATSLPRRRKWISVVVLALVIVGIVLGVVIPLASKANTLEPAPAGPASSYPGSNDTTRLFGQLTHLCFA